MSKLMKIEFDDGARVIHESSGEQPCSPEPYPESYYEVDRVVNTLTEMFEETEKKLIKVGIQLPTNLLGDSFRVCQLLSQRLSPHRWLIFVLGDSSFGRSCCDDFVSAAHLEADAIVHYDHACFSCTGSIPVVYAGRLPLHVSNVVNAFHDREEGNKRIVLLCDSVYRYASCEIADALRLLGYEVIAGYFPTCAKSHPSISSIQLGGMHVDFPSVEEDLSSYDILYISRDNAGSAMDILASATSGPHPAKSFTTYTPNTETLTHHNPSIVTKFLSKRFYLIQKVKSTQIIAILIHSYHLQSFQTQITALRTSIRNSGRTCYTVVVGKINLAKIANFAEVQAYIVLGCPDSCLSVIHSSNEFHVPIITPFEWLFVLDKLVWDGTYRFILLPSDLHKLVSHNVQQDEGTDDDADAPYFSMITGKFESSLNVDAQHHTQQLPDATPSQQQLTQKNQDNAIISPTASTAAQFLKQREYRGLEANIGSNPVMPAVQGQSGIASDYGQR